MRDKKISSRERKIWGDKNRDKKIDRGMRRRGDASLLAQQRGEENQGEIKQEKRMHKGARRRET